MKTGTIKFFNAGKGFGFITPDDDAKDIFLPAAAVTAAKISKLNAGQRVEFDVAPDAKGPKVVQFRLLAQAAIAVPKPAPARVAIYCDPSTESSAEVLDTVQKAGFAFDVLDYVQTPPSHDVLRRLSAQLNETGQSLVRRFDPMFRALQLDDRFIGESEFWTSVVEHPALINGPVVVLSGRARICKSGEEVEAFFENRDIDSPTKPKRLSSRLMAMLRGEAVAPIAVPKPAIADEEADIEKRAKPPISVAPKKPGTKPAVKSKPRQVETKAVSPKAARSKAPAKPAGKKTVPAKKAQSAARPAKPKKK